MTEPERPSREEYQYIARRVAEEIGDDSLIGAILTNYTDAYHLVSEEEREGVARFHIELLKISRETRKRKGQEKSQLEGLLAGLDVNQEQGRVYGGAH